MEFMNDFKKNWKGFNKLSWYETCVIFQNFQEKKDKALNLINEIRKL
jgi:hypothetical protein